MLDCLGDGHDCVCGTGLSLQQLGIAMTKDVVALAGAGTKGAKAERWIR